MLTQHTERLHSIERTRALRTVIVVGQPGQQLPDSAFDAVDYDVVVLEPVTRAYSQIKRVKPALIVMSLSFDDHGAFQLLSMLRLDSDTAWIPIRMFVASETEPESEEEDSPDEGDAFPAAGLLMN